MSETVKVITNGKEHEIEARPITILCHKDIMNIKVPDRFEINPENTLAEIRSLNQEQWTHISTGEIFKHLFRLVYPLPDEKNHTAPKTEVVIPAQLEELQNSEMGIRHVAGLIILAMIKGGIEGKELFFKQPEAYLHPAYQCNLMDMFIVLPQIVEYMQSLPSGGTPPEPKPKTPMESWLGE